MELAEVASEISSECRVEVQSITGDLASQHNRRKLCNRIKEAGNMDVLVNNAGFRKENLLVYAAAIVGLTLSIAGTILYLRMS